jgi:hypothetical protein
MNDEVFMAFLHGYAYAIQAQGYGKQSGSCRF